MPVVIQHAILHTFVIVMIVAILAATTYTIVINMLTDTYRYEKSVEKANEKLRLAAAIGSNGFFYGVRNIGLTDVFIVEAGVIDSSNVKRVLFSNVRLSPGSATIGSQPNPGNYVTFYVVTDRNNVFSTRVVNLTQQQTSYPITIRNLVPSVAVEPAPVQYLGNYTAAVSVAMYGYVFAYLFVKDPYSDQMIYLKVGPTPVSDMFKKQLIPYISERVMNSTISLYASMNIIFNVKDSDSDSYWPHYEFVVPIDVERTDGDKGLVIHGCFGFIWRTMTSNLFSFRLQTNLNSVSSRSSPSGKFYVESRYFVTLVPSSLDVDTLVSTLETANSYSLVAPSGSQVYIVLAKCFKIEDMNLKSFVTSDSKPYWEDVSRGIKIYTVMDFPGKTYIGQNTYEILDGIEITIDVNPEIYVKTVLTQV